MDPRAKFIELYCYHNIKETFYYNKYKGTSMAFNKGFIRDTRKIPGRYHKKKCRHLYNLEYVRVLRSHYQNAKILLLKSFIYLRFYFYYYVLKCIKIQVAQW